jgi:C-terminal processing protease CtpA/Prc
MRHLIALGLCVCVAGSAAAQTEVIIRRPGEQDQVIHLDSARTREEMAKTQVQLRKATTSIQQRVQEIQQQLNREQMFKEPQRMNTIALRNAEIATQNLIAPMMKHIAELQRQPHLGIGVDTRPRDTDKWGAYVTSVTPGSPADKAGILSGDIIMRIAGKSLTEKPGKGDGREESSPGLRLINIVSQLEEGRPVAVELRRGTQNRTVKVTPVEDDTPSIARLMPDRSPMTGNFAWTMPGRAFSGTLAPGRESPEAMMQLETPRMSVFSDGTPSSYFYSFGSNSLFANLELAPVNEKLGTYFGTSEGVLVVNTDSRGGVLLREYRTDSTHARARAGGVRVIEADSINAPANGPLRAVNTLGLEPGDVIVSVDGRKVTTPSQLMRIVATYDRGEEFKLQIMRQKRAEALTAKMP